MILTKDLRRILDIGIALTNEKDYSLLLERILKESMEITDSDAGTLYLLHGDRLEFKIMQNKTLRVSQGGAGEGVDMPDVPLKEENICAYCAIHKKIINIEDVYCSEEFDFKGPKNYDKLTSYRTQSMLVFPLENHEYEILGVIQLINAMDDSGNVCSYTKEDEYIVFSLASQTTVTLTNMIYMNEMKELLNSMVSTLTAAIDERAPYNANHTKNVARYTSELIDYINELYSENKTSLYYDSERKEQVVMAAMLHDVGKIITPLEIMNKPDRLGIGPDTILNRFKLLEAWQYIDYLEGRMTKEEWQESKKILDEAAKFVVFANKTPYISDDMLHDVQILANRKYVDTNGNEHLYITEEEKECLSIRTGTLTDGERKIMERHVVITSRLLSEMRFGKKYSQVPLLAATHHEYLDGSGYPNHLNADTIPYDSRLIAIVDIFDSLISSDRPYKKAVPVKRAIQILWEMVREGKLDGEIVKYLEDYVERKQMMRG